jgi:hypothetical protein
MDAHDYYRIVTIQQTWSEAVAATRRLAAAAADARQVTGQSRE